MNNKMFFFSIFVISSFLLEVRTQVTVVPEQVHLSYGLTPNQMHVTWLTFNVTKYAVVEYGMYTLNIQAFGAITKFVDGGKLQSVRYTHRVLLPDLEPGTKYYYRCGSEGGWSDIFDFYAMKNGTDWSPRFAIYGDMGTINAYSIPRLTNDVNKDMYDAIFHAGDMAYDLSDDNGRNGDKFMRMIEPLAAKVPYMTCPGNHEYHYNFANYKNRFTMPGANVDKTYYSFNVGPAHVISISTEIYFYIMEIGFTHIYKQYHWLEKDLAEANINRAVRPWIIIVGHRPMYCSNNNSDHCTEKSNRVRVGVSIFHEWGLENLLYKYGVDLAIWAHENSYERLWPIYNYKVYNGSMSAPYTDPKAPVHVTTGSAGCKEKIYGFKKPQPAWSARRISDYGYTRLTVVNATHLHLGQLSVKTGRIVDEITLIKNKHGPYTDA